MQPEVVSYVCPCGAPAPSGLPGPGRPPVRCAACATPLVAPGPVPAAGFERGLGAALIVAVLGAAGWAALCHFLRTGAPWTLAAAGLVVGVAARTAARSRGGRVQLAAALALLVFFVLGEFLIYRHALLPRLQAMHAAEGAADSHMRAEEELERIREDPERYASIEATRDLFLAVAAGLAAALWITRARPAVAAFTAPAPRAAAEPASDAGASSQGDGAGVAVSGEPSSSTSSEPPPTSPPASSASPEPDPPAPRSPDAS